MRIPLFFTLLTAAILVPTAHAGEPDQAAADAQILKAVGVELDDAALLDYFRKRTLLDAERPKVAALVQRLGDEVFIVRNRASNELIDTGATALPLLREALTNPDVEVVRRATRCLEAIEKGLNPSASLAAARMLARHKPPAAAEVLLGYLPFAEDEMVSDEIRTSLAAVAMRDGKPEPVLVQGMKDKLTVRRAAAAEALIKAKALSPAEGRKHLADSDALVRLWTGLALAQLKDKEALPPLIALLTELPRERAWQVEDVLCRLAGDQAPPVSLGDDDVGRRQCRDKWAEWWQKNADKADLARLTDGQRMLGYTVITSLDQRNTGKVYEIGLDGKPRWKIENLQFPIDAQVLPGERVLIAEMNGGRVTERDFKGKVLWEKAVQMPLACQRLPNGNTFIATRNQLLEYDRSGKEVFKHDRNDFGIYGGAKLRNGQYGMITSFGTFIRLDSSGKEVKSINVSQNLSLTGVDALPSGRVLIPIWGENKVVEYDPDGKSVWEATVNNPVSAMRLPNGNTLVASMGGGQVLELDRSGKKVWEHKVDGRPWRARRR